MPNPVLIQVGAWLPDYPEIEPAIASFTITLIDSCYGARLERDEASLADFPLEYLIEVGGSTPL